MIHAWYIRGIRIRLRMSSLRVLAVSIVTFVAMCASGRSQTQQVTITVDDLPYTNGPDCDSQETLSITEALLKPLRDARIPVLGLVVGTRCSNLTREQKAHLLQMWLDAGGELGNHTWS